MLAGEGEALTRKAVELALAGDPAAIRLCLERMVGPYRDRAVAFAMPPIHNAADLAAAMSANNAATAEGAITPREAMQFGHIVEAYVRAVEATEFERRCARLSGRCRAALLDNRLEQVEDRRGSAARAESAAAVRQRRLLRTEAALGEIIRETLNRAGVNTADAPRLALSDEAAAALAAIPDTAQLRDGDAMAPASLPTG